MKRVLWLILLAALMAAGVWFWTLLFPGPEKIIRQRLARVAGEASFKSGENALVGAARAETLAGFFSTNAELNLELPERGGQHLAGREEITQAAVGARSAVSSLKVEFPDMNITVGPDKLSAVAEVVVRVQDRRQPG